MFGYTYLIGDPAKREKLEPIKYGLWFARLVARYSLELFGVLAILSNVLQISAW